MSVDCFIDTNIFIYSLERLDERKADKADRLIETGIATGNAYISFQVVQECLNTAIRKAEIPLTTDEMKMYLKAQYIQLLKRRFLHKRTHYILEHCTIFKNYYLFT